MSFNYFHTNIIMPSLMMANKDFFIKKILPNPNNLQIFIEKESFKIAIKNYEGEGVKPKVKKVTANTIAEYFVVFVEFDDDYVLEDTDNYAVAIAITKEKMRYFTYEKRTDESTNDDICIVGELELNNNEIGKHIEYSKTIEYNIGYFAGNIEDVLNNK